MRLLDDAADQNNAASAPDNCQGESMGDLLGKLGGGDAARSAGLLVGVMSLVQHIGGFESLIQTLQRRGMGDAAQSWLSNGANMPLGTVQVNKVFGADALATLGRQTGMDAKQAGTAVGVLLPALVNQFSPKGKLANNHQAMLEQSLGMFANALR